MDINRARTVLQEALAKEVVEERRLREAARIAVPEVSRGQGELYQEGQSEREIAFALVDKCHGRKVVIEAALERIEAGIYGTCTRCETPINGRRLKAIPWARLCLPCQKRVEANAGPFRRFATA